QGQWQKRPAGATVGTRRRRRRRDLRDLLRVQGDRAQGDLVPVADCIEERLPVPGETGGKLISRRWIEGERRRAVLVDQQKPLAALADDLDEQLPGLRRQVADLQRSSG